jgi:3'(2'), 5'-bisphosphate nucleotidase
MADRLERALLAVRLGSEAARRVQAEKVVNALEKPDKSPVTVADFAVQAIVAHHIGALVGEESAAEATQDRRIFDATVEAVRSVWPEATPKDVEDAIGLGGAEPTREGFWTLDPIDGTKGFLRGEQYSVSLAYVENGRPVLGVLGCPNLPADPSKAFAPPDPVGVLYYAIEGQGAFEVATAGPRRISAAAPSDAITFCESVESDHSDQAAHRRIIDTLGVTARSVRIDSQCKYAVVARGQAHAYLRLPTRKDYVEKIWDHAAGAIVATEAGCTVSDVNGKALDFSTGRGLRNNSGVVVAAALFHARLIDALR